MFSTTKEKNPKLCQGIVIVFIYGVETGLDRGSNLPKVTEQLVIEPASKFICLTPNPAQLSHLNDSVREGCPGGTEEKQNLGR